jgi:hypothetical protein
MKNFSETIGNRTRDHVCSVRGTNLRGSPSTGNRCTAENVFWSSYEVTLVIYPVALGLIPYVVHVVCVPDLYSYRKPSSRSRDISQNILCSSCVVNWCNVPDMKIVPLGPEIQEKMYFVVHRKGAWACCNDSKEMLDKMSENSNMNTSAACGILKHWVPQDAILVFCFLWYKRQ